MKQLKDLSYPLFIAVLALLIVSCSNDEDDIQYSPLRVTHEDGSGLYEENFSSDGETLVMSIKSTVPWTVETDASWLTITPDSGDGDATVTVTAGVNDIDTRTAMVTISSSVANVSFIRFKVTQTYKVVLLDEYYVTPDGDGNGSSWESPMSAARMGSLLSGDSELSDVPFYLSEGEFKLGGSISVSQKDIRIYGGYSMESTGTSLDLKGGETILSGDLSGDGTANAGDCAIFDFTNCNVRISDIIFENGYAGDRGSAITVHGSTSDTEVELTNCIVRNCVSTNSDKYGAALSMCGGILKLDNVQILNNVATNRGAGITMNEAESSDEHDSYLFMNNCTLSGNTVQNDWGNALNSRRGFFCINNSTFYGAQGSNNNSAVINADASCILVNSTFIGNEGNLWVVRNNNGDANTLGIANCLFVKNGTVNSSVDTGDVIDVLSRGWNVFQGTNFSLLNTDTDGTNFIFDGIDTASRWYEWTAPALSSYATHQEILSTMRSINASIAEMFIEWVGEANFAKDQRGESRNSSKMQPGAFDPGL